MNIPSNSFTSSISSSPPRHVWSTDSPHLKTSDIRIDNGDLLLEKCDIKHDTLANAKSAIAWGYTSHENASPRATSTCRPTVYYSSEGDKEKQQLSTICQHQQHKRENQETELTSEQAQSDVLNENIGTASCFDSFLRACDAIATVIMEEVDTNDDGNETCTRGNNDSVRSNNVIGRKVVRFDSSRNTTFLF